MTSRGPKRESAEEKVDKAEQRLQPTAYLKKAFVRVALFGAAMELSAGETLKGKDLPELLLKLYHQHCGLLLSGSREDKQAYYNHPLILELLSTYDWDLEDLKGQFTKASVERARGDEQCDLRKMIPALYKADCFDEMKCHKPDLLSREDLLVSLKRRTWEFSNKSAAEFDSNKPINVYHLDFLTGVESAQNG